VSVLGVELPGLRSLSSVKSALVGDLFTLRDLLPDSKGDVGGLFLVKALSWPLDIWVSVSFKQMLSICSCMSLDE
jgi:hypothetical protein